MKSIEVNKIYKEEIKERRKVWLSSKVRKPKKSKSLVISVSKVNKKAEMTRKKKKRIELLKRAKAVVYARDKNICQHCDISCSWSNRHASHVIPVSATGRLALYPLNMKVLCYHCHINWRHKNPTEAWERYKKKFPDRLYRLRELQLAIPSWSITVSELEEIEKMIEIDEKSLAIHI